MKSLNSEVGIERNSVATLFVGLYAPHTREHTSAVFAADKSNSSRSGCFSQTRKVIIRNFEPTGAADRFIFGRAVFNQTTNSLSVGFAVSVSDNRIRPSEQSFESHVSPITAGPYPVGFFTQPVLSCSASKARSTLPKWSWTLCLAS